MQCCVVCVTMSELVASAFTMKNVKFDFMLLVYAFFLFQLNHLVIFN